MKELINIQAELKAPKGQFNSFGKYKYRSCEDILEAVKPLLTKNKCTLTLSDSVEQVGDRIYLKATATLSNGTESVLTTAYARESMDKKGMDDSQITGTASSYARKYALNGLFCIDDTKDADTDEYVSKTITDKPADDKISKKDVEMLKKIILEVTGKEANTFYNIPLEQLTNEQYGKALNQLNEMRERNAKSDRKAK